MTFDMHVRMEQIWRRMDAQSEYRRADSTFDRDMAIRGHMAHTGLSYKDAARDLRWLRPVEEE